MTFTSRPELPDVYSAEEVARAARVPVAAVRQLIDAGIVATVDGEFVTLAEAVRVGRALATGESLRASLSTTGTSSLASSHFATRMPAHRETGLPIAVSSLVHACVIGGAVLLTMAGVGGSETTTPVDLKQEVRLVYLTLPGPGGGGGGGGLRQPKPPAPAKRKGVSALRSPMPERKPTPPVQPEPPKPEPPPPPAPPEPVQAPIATVAADEKDQTGVMSPPKTESNARGPGAGGGAGTGAGTGLGEGQGSGVGDGSGGGEGGGPYRPGSGVTPPRLVREVKAEYTEDARRRGIQGEVTVEVVISRDGAVSNVRLLRGLGHGLDEQAIRAVRQWRFTPATRRGTPVDVIVEIDVEFRVR
jgi:periplasmic protein TonB